MDKIQQIFKSIISRPKILLIVLVGLILLIFIGWKTLIGGSKQPQYQTAKAEKGTIISSINASGHVMTSNIMNVTTGATGLIKQVYVKDDDEVTAGQEILEITLDQTSQAKKASAFADYQNAVTAFKNAQNTQRAAKATLDKVLDDIHLYQYGNGGFSNIGSNNETATQKQDRTTAQVNLDKANDAITSAQVQLSSTGLSLQQSSDVVTAPISGTVTNLAVIPGMVLSGSGGTTSSTSQTSTTSNQTQTLAVVKNEANPILSFNLTEIDVPKVKIGQKATVTLDSIPDKTFTGEVVTVDRIGTTSNNVTNYQVVIKLDTTSVEILPNMAANAGIIVETKNDVLLVPSTAVQTQNGQSFARVLQNGREQQVTVQVGISSDTQTEITSGLSEGDEVVTGTATSQSSQQTGGSIFGGGGFGGGAFRPGGFGGGGGSQNRRQ